jgi:hypothetical protein
MYILNMNSRLSYACMYLYVSLYVYEYAFADECKHVQTHTHTERYMLTKLTSALSNVSIVLSPETHTHT